MKNSGYRVLRVFGLYYLFQKTEWTLGLKSTSISYWHRGTFRSIFGIRCWLKKNAKFDNKYRQKINQNKWLEIVNAVKSVNVSKD